MLKSASKQSVPENDAFPYVSIDKQSIDIYMDEVQRYNLLSPDEEKDLLERMQAGDEKAREQLINCNLRLVVKIAHQYKQYGVPLQDLISEGNLGLMHAIDLFNLEKGTRVSTYASWWIRQAIRKAIIKQGKTIRLPAHVFEKLSVIRKAKADFFEQNKRNPSVAEIADLTGLSSRKVALLEDAIKHPKSLESKVKEGEENSQTLKDTLSDGAATDASLSTAEKGLLQDIKAIIAMLDNREAQILRARFGLTGDESKTLEEIGAEMNLTRERIRQIEVLAIEKIRRILQEKEKPYGEEERLSPLSLEERINAFDRLLKARNLKEVEET